MNSNDILIIGVGNLYRRDDSAGVVAVRKLKKAAAEDVEIIEHSGEGVTLMEAWKNRTRVILVDAVKSGAKPGCLHRVNAVLEELPLDWFSCSTHNFGIAEAVELARTLEQLPAELWVFGIEGSDFSPGEGMSREVEQAVDQVVDEIMKCINTGEADNA